MCDAVPNGSEVVVLSQRMASFGTQGGWWQESKWANVCGEWSSQIGQIWGVCG